MLSSAQYKCYSCYKIFKMKEKKIAFLNMSFDELKNISKYM